MKKRRYQVPAGYIDESVPAHPELDASYPMVVFGDHKLCAGKSTLVQTMPGAHMHSQIEFNIVRRGHMVYRYDGQEFTLGEGKMAVFWGMIPHQVIDHAPQTEFCVIYVPMSAFLEFPDLNDLRQRLFAGAFLEARQFNPHDFALFQEWRSDLLTGDDHLEQLVRDELTARLRRIDRNGWTDLRNASPQKARTTPHDPDHERARKVEDMARYIGEHALDAIDVRAVAEHVNLHPNYAMDLYKRAMGMTIKQTIMRHRLDTARSMLLASDMPVAAVAFDCGFGSLSAFYVAFEQRFKTTPSLYRSTVIGRH